MMVCISTTFLLNCIASQSEGSPVVCHLSVGIQGVPPKQYTYIYIYIHLSLSLWSSVVYKYPIYIYIYIYISISLSLSLYIYIYIYIQQNLGAQIPMSGAICIYMCVCVFVCVCVALKKKNLVPSEPQSSWD